MSDLKSLMSARRALSSSSTPRLNHPYAQYDSPSTSSGAGGGKMSSQGLSCSLCGLKIKHVALWSSHLVSKGHRVNVRKVEKEEEVRNGKKRKVDAQDPEANDSHLHHSDQNSAILPLPPTPPIADHIQSTTKDTTTGLPDDFFADPSMAPSSLPRRTPSTSPPLLSSTQIAPQLDATAQTSTADAFFDAEWAAFEASLNDDDHQTSQSSSLKQQQPPPRGTGKSAKATLYAAPVVYEFGAPAVREEGEGENGGEGDEEEEEDVEEDEEETEEEKRERLDREEREEIMERMRQEEREQMEADEKVVALKRRLDLIRQARTDKRASQAKS